MKKGVIFLSNIIAPYNISLFNKLNSLLNGNVFFVFDQLKEYDRSWKVEETKIKFDYQIMKSWNLKLRSRVGNGATLTRTVYFPFYLFLFIWKQKPGIVISIEFGLRTIFSLLVSKSIGAKFLVVSDVTSFTEQNIGKFKKFLRKLIVKGCDGVIARSYKAKMYVESLGFENEKIIVAPYAIDKYSASSEISEIIKRVYTTKEERFCFLYCGHFNSLKGVDTLCKVVNDIPKEIQNKMVFIMAGGTEAELLDVAPSYNKKLFHPIGYVSTLDLLNLYVHVDCLILPTKSDTWALVVNEAVSAGCPVMVSKYAGSADELIVHNQSGIVFDPLNENNFKEMLTFCIDNHEVLKNFAREAEKKLVEYNNDVSASRIFDFLKKL